jgi:hypothetical protein
MVQCSFLKLNRPKLIGGSPFVHRPGSKLFLASVLGQSFENNVIQFVDSQPQDRIVNLRRRLAAVKYDAIRALKNFRLQIRMSCKKHFDSSQLVLSFPELVQQMRSLNNIKKHRGACGPRRFRGKSYFDWCFVQQMQKLSFNRS